MVRAMRFIVMLEERLHGAAGGSTEDVFEAKHAREAEELALRDWRVAKPGRTFTPLLTIALHGKEEVGRG
jgi:hypothetical protein